MLAAAIRLLGIVPIGTICLYRLVTLALNARSWQVLLPPESRPAFPTLLRLRWIGESVNSLLPVAQVGGDVARAALVTSKGVPRAEAAASMVADFATGIVSQLVFGIAGAIALVSVLPRGGAQAGAWANVVAGLAVATLVVVVLSILLQLGAARAAARFLARCQARRSWGKLAGSLRRLDLAVTTLVGRERTLAAAFAWHLAGWLSQVGETWILLEMFGHPVSFHTALAIESLTAAARGAAFFIPSGIGVQEVTIVSICRLVGVDMELALALGIAKRARELVVGVPGLVAWMVDQRWWRKWRRIDD